MILAATLNFAAFNFEIMTTNPFFPKRKIFPRYLHSAISAISRLSTSGGPADPEEFWAELRPQLKLIETDRDHGLNTSDFWFGDSRDSTKLFDLKEFQKVVKNWCAF